MNYDTFLSPKKMVLIFLTLILSYFIYHIYQGDRGLKALELKYAELKKKHDVLHEERLNLENKVNSFGAGDGQIDKDLLTEHAKKMGYSYPNEVMIQIND